MEAGQRPRPQQPQQPQPRPPLRQPQTSPAPGAQPQAPAAPRPPSGEPPAAAAPPCEDAASRSAAAPAQPQVVGAPERTSSSGVQPAEPEPSCADAGEAGPALSAYAQAVLQHLTQQPASFDTEVQPFADNLNALVTTEDALRALVELLYQHTTAAPHFSYLGARLCNYLAQHLTLKPQSGSFLQLLLKRCQREYETKDQAAAGDEATRKGFHSFVLFLGELYLNVELRGPPGQQSRVYILELALPELLDALLSTPVDSNLICAVKLLKMTGAALEDAWNEQGMADMEELMQRVENLVLDADCSREPKLRLLELLELRASDWGRVPAPATYTEATPENDPDYFMNEPTFYTEDGTPFTAADPDYEEKYHNVLDRDYFFPEEDEDEADFPWPGDTYWDDMDDEMDPEIAEAYEEFCLELETKKKQYS